jgi:hypothetical protein
MTQKTVKNMSASVRAKLLELSRKEWRIVQPRHDTQSLKTKLSIWLAKAIDQIRAFLLPILDGLTQPTSNSQKWTPKAG